MKFTKEQLQMYIETLERMKTERYKEYNGICYNLLIMSGEPVSLFEQSAYTFVSEYSEGWKYHTGSYIFPVPDVENSTAWEGKHLEYRLSLIDYLITKAKEDLENSYVSN